MAVFESKILDVIRSFAASLQLSMLLPACLLIGGLLWLSDPSVVTAPDNSLVILVLFVVIMVSYLLHAFNMPIIRLFEGYILSETPPAKILRSYQLSKFYTAHICAADYLGRARRVSTIENQLQRDKPLTDFERERLRRWREGWMDLSQHQLERLEERFPRTSDRILATGLGNTIAAFEQYPQNRYEIDMVQLWTRFVPTLVEKKYAGYIEGEKAILDFFVNLLVVSGPVWLGAATAFASTGRVDAGILFALLPALALAFYKGACVAASNWGVTVKAAFDLYRLDLRRALNVALKDDATLDDERSMWQGLSQFLAYGDARNLPPFKYHRPEPQSDAAKAKEEK